MAASSITSFRWNRRSTKWAVLGANNDAVLGKRGWRKTSFQLSEKRTFQEVRSQLPISRFYVELESPLGIQALILKQVHR